MRELVRLKGVQHVDFYTTTFDGALKVFSPTRESFLSQYWQSVLGVDGSSLGFAKREKSDLGLRYDPSTAFMDPFEPLTLGLFCDIVRANGEVLGVAPHTILRKAQNTWARLVNGHFLIFMEVEFFIGPKRNSSFCPFSAPQGTYYGAAGAHDLHRTIRKEIVETMRKVGIPIRYHHVECGGDGISFLQHEVELNYATPLRAVEHYLLARYVIERVAQKYGLEACFDPKPLQNTAGSGTHIHCKQVGYNGRSLFYSPTDTKHLSDLAKTCIYSILQCSPALAAFAAPTLQSYARLGVDEAPEKPDVGEADRSAVVRLPACDCGPRDRSFELRLPDGSSHMDLVVAAMLAAMIDGYTRGGTYMPAGTNLERLPTSVFGAAQALRNNHGFLRPFFPEEALRMQDELLMGRAGLEAIMPAVLEIA